MARLSLLLISSSVLLSSASALTCFVNDDQGNTVERSDPEWKYCSLIPFSSSNGSGRLNGVGATNENLAGYDATFGQGSKLYTVMAMCILEKYDFAAINPAFGPAPEYMFRCFCNTDRRVPLFFITFHLPLTHISHSSCNKESSFSKFISSRRV